MSEMVLPGVYIDVRPEGLIVPGRVGVGTVAVVGTANKGPLLTPVRLGSLADARSHFGNYDPWVDGASQELTLVRALDLAFGHGATTIIGLRVSDKDNAGDPTAQYATLPVASPAGTCVTLTAASRGTWGNDLRAGVSAADLPPFVESEEHTGPTVTLNSGPVLANSRNRVAHRSAATGFTRYLAVSYDGAPAPGPGQVQINRATRSLTFGDTIDNADTVTAWYSVDPHSGVKVTVRLMRGLEVAAEETYNVVSGRDLTKDVNNPLAPSALVTAEAAANAAELPDKTSGAFLPFAGGSNGAAAGAGDYRDGFDVLLSEDAHLMVAAGQDQSFGDHLDAHCQLASTDTFKRDRIGVVGSGVGAAGLAAGIRAHNLASDRIVFAAPGIVTTDAAAPGQPSVILPGAYTAAAVAGLLSRYPPHVSLTNKPLSVDGVNPVFTRPELSDLVISRVFVVEQKQGFRVVRGITTSTNTAWQQITTRRIVDYAKYGVRSAAEPYIGLLNNERVRGALRATVNSFLTGMVDDEMLISYELDVSATRAEQIQGIARVTIVLRPVFSIDFIKVTMFLE
jgi:hypothetical protein